MSFPQRGSTSVRPEVCDVEGEGDDLVGAGEQEIELDKEENEEESEARAPRTLRDPGAPSAKEVEDHNVTHLPFRAWCAACVSGKARDRLHHRREQESKDIPEIVFDYCFMGDSDDAETLAIQVARDRRTRMIFAHVVPRKGMTHEYGANAMVEDLKRLGYHELILKCDGEPALRSVQEEVKRRRESPTILENSPVGDSRANGAAERAVQAVQEQVRVIRHGLEQRLGQKIRSSHPIMTWIVEHAAALLSRYQVGDDGKTPYERLKGKKYGGTEVEIGEKVHHKYKKDTMNHKMESRWGEGFYLGKVWRTGEAAIGTKNGVVKAGTIRRVGAHRRWDAQGLEKIQGVPWKWNPDSDDAPRELRLRWLSDSEKDASATGLGDYHGVVYRMRLKREDFFRHGFTEGCPGCRALLAGGAARGHHDACRSRMETAISADPDGSERRERQKAKEDEYLTRVLENRFAKEDKSRQDDENAKKRIKTANGEKQEDVVRDDGGRPGSSGDPGNGGLPAVVRPMESDTGKRSCEGGVGGDEKRPKQESNDRQDAPGEPEDPDMEISAIERCMQEDFLWKTGARSDMCELPEPQVAQQVADFSYYDENTWEELDPEKVMAAERDELERFRKMAVYTYVDKQRALADEGEVRESQMGPCEQGIQRGSKGEMPLSGSGAWIR